MKKDTDKNFMVFFFGFLSIIAVSIVFMVTIDMLNTPENSIPASIDKESQEHPLDLEFEFNY